MSERVKPLDEMRQETAREFTLHHKVCYRIIAGAQSILTSDLNNLYEAVAPVAYKGSTKTPISSRKYRRDILYDLKDADAIVGFRTANGIMWAPTEEVIKEELPGSQPEGRVA